MVVNRPSVQGVIYDRENEKFLIIGKKHPDTNKIIWRLVKGGIEDGETDTEALKREIEEEVGLRNIIIRDKVHYYEFLYKTYDMNHLVSSYFVEANMSEKIVLQGESEDETPIVDYVWLSYYETQDKLFWKNERQSIKNSIIYL